jgi:hypothetical protein
LIFYPNYIYMICLNPIINNPFFAGLFAFACAMFYLFLMTFGSTLPQMVLFSMAVGLVVYYVRGGRLLCDETAITSEPVASYVPPEQVPTSEVTAPIVARSGQAARLNNCGTPGMPACSPISAYKL